MFSGKFVTDFSKDQLLQCTNLYIQKHTIVFTCYSAVWKHNIPVLCWPSNRYQNPPIIIHNYKIQSDFRFRVSDSDVRTAESRNPLPIRKICCRLCFGGEIIIHPE